MGKLGKKARKFAKKNLQSVLRNRRKTKALFKRRTRKDGRNDVEEEVEDSKPLSNGDLRKRYTGYESIFDISVGTVSTGNNFDEVADLSASDGYLSEDSSTPYTVASESSIDIKDETAESFYSTRNEKIQARLSRQKEKLEKLRKKDLELSKLLEGVNSVQKPFQDTDEYSEGESSDQADQDVFDLSNAKDRLLTNEVITKWCQEVKEKKSTAVLVLILNAYRAACHYGAEASVYKIEDTEAFNKIVLFTLSNATDVFKDLLQLSSSKSGKDALLEVNKNPKWNSMKSLVKSFLRSTLFLLNQVTDTDILASATTRVRASLVFFTAFPSLILPLIKVSIHFWATGERVLSSASFFVIRDLVTVFGCIKLDICLAKMFSAFLSRSRVEEISDISSMRLLSEHLVQLCSLDVPNSSHMASASLSQLAKLLAWGQETKNKEAIRKICSWEYVNCLDVWVRFVAENIRDHDIQQLCFLAIQLVNGLTLLFPAQRYFPLRLRCIEWLNTLSRSSGAFIPLTSIVFDIFEYKFVKDGRKDQNPINVSSVLKLPKHYLKSKTFQEECYKSAVEQLSIHLSQWSYHISFPDLAAIPLIRLKKTWENLTTESHRRAIKRLIDQVEQNVDFVQKRRDEVSFSPNDHQSVDSFLQLEKSSLNASFMQYYRSVSKHAE